MRQEMTAAQKALAVYDVFATSIMLGTGAMATASAAGRTGANVAVESMVSGAGLSCINLPTEAIFMMGTAAALLTVRGFIATTGNIIDLVGRCGCFAKKSDAMSEQDLERSLTHVAVDFSRPSAQAATLDV